MTMLLSFIRLNVILSLTFNASRDNIIIIFLIRWRVGVRVSIVVVEVVVLGLGKRGRILH